METTVAPKGVFQETLKRSNSKIKQDRAEAIAESAQIIYRRELEDNEIQLKQLVRERAALLDLSPTSADSLILASDFDAKRFVEKDIDLGVKIRNLEIRLEIARKQYAYLFGE